MGVLRKTSEKRLGEEYPKEGYDDVTRRGTHRSSFGAGSATRVLCVIPRRALLDVAAGLKILDVVDAAAEV